MTIAATAAIAFATHATAADGPPPVPKSRVAFAKGSSSATINGTLKGRSDVDYVVRAAAGQTLEVKMDASSKSSEFNVLPPGSSDVAMYNSGMTGERRYSGVLPADGDYAIRVYQNRAAGRRGETAKYVLTVSVTGKPLPPLSAARDAKVAGTAYHATAQVSCVPPYASAPTQCDAGVIRRGNDGTATVELRKDKLVRRILFVHGEVVATDSTDPASLTKEGDLNRVKIGDERYDFPDAFLNGG